MSLLYKIVIKTAKYEEETIDMNMADNTEPPSAMAFLSYC